MGLEGEVQVVVAIDGKVIGLLTLMVVGLEDLGFTESCTLFLMEAGADGAVPLGLKAITDIGQAEADMIVCHCCASIKNFPTAK